MNAFVLREGPSPPAIRVIPFPSPPPRSQSATLTAPALLATHRPQPSPFAARDSQPSPFAASPRDLRADTSIHAPASAAMRRRDRVSFRADLEHASSPVSVVRRSPSPLRSHPTTGGTGGAHLLPLRGNFSLRGELMHAFVSYRVATEGTGAKREFFIDNLLVRIHLSIVMMRWTGLAPWGCEFPVSGSLPSTFLVPGTNLIRKNKFDLIWLLNGFPPLIKLSF